MRLFISFKCYASQLKSPSNSLSKPSTFSFSISIMKDSGPSIFYAEITKSLNRGICKTPALLRTDLLCCWTNNFNCVCSVTKIVFTEVKRFFLDNLCHWALCTTTSRLILLTSRSVTTLLLVEGLVWVWCTILLLDYEIRWSFKVLLTFTLTNLWLMKCVRVLANVS